jgi:biopolymer transport protein ExbD
MKITPRKATAMTGDTDMTPMIDMTFQLIIFLMLLVNFTEVDQNAAIKLPSSELAKPPEEALEDAVTLNVKENKTILAGGTTVLLEGLKGLMDREAAAISGKGHDVKNAHVIIRGHANAKAGVIQEVIKVCQEARFEKFALRATEEVK